MINTFTLLLLYQLAGEIIVRLMKLPIPGAVIGMLLLLLTLLVRKKVNDEIRHGSASLLKHLSLLFVPIGTGIVVHLDRVASEWLPIAAATIVSTFLGIAVTAWVLNTLSKTASESKPS